MSQTSELKTAEEWTEAWPIVHSLRTNLTQEQFLSNRANLISNGYHLFGLRDEGRLVSVAGLTMYPRLTGRECWVYDLATAESERSKGYGEEILNFVQNYAKKSGCTNICLHTRLSRTDAQRFYETRAKWEKYAFVYKKNL